MEVVEYRTKEGQPIQRGQIIAVVENWWARMALGPGVLGKTFFDRGTYVKEGDDGGRVWAVRLFAKE